MVRARELKLWESFWALEGSVGMLWEALDAFARSHGAAVRHAQNASVLVVLGG